MKTQSDLPTGTVTFFFSDVQDSTGLLQRMASRYKDVLERHADIIRSSLASHDGVEISTEGDSFFAVFRQADQAVAAATEIQQQLAAADWPAGGTVAVRIGLHSGTGELGHDNYVGIDVNRAARISAAGHGGQVVVSEAVRALAGHADYSDLGLHSLKGLEKTEHLYQLEVEGLPHKFPPLRSTGARPNNLPAMASEIIGRETEEAQLRELVAANRFVTLTGPGGIGKTRLALEVAGDVLNDFEMGAFFVDLAPLEDPDLVLPEIASTVGIKGSAKGDLGSALSDGERLLVLDNLEQLVAAAPLLAALMAGAAPLTVLATSQVALRIAGETVMRLEPLVVDDATSPAVELFMARAAQTDPAFDLEQHRDDVVRLVELLDGVPLAIELAAARMNVLTPAEVTKRIDSGVLKSSRADTPERHRSIIAAVEWSYGLLTSGQQELLRSLSVFHGGATLAAIEAVLLRDPLDDLAELVDRSLLSVGTATVGKRFRMLAPVHVFASNQVDNSEALADGHAGFFYELAMEAHEPLDGDKRASWIAILNDELDNMRATLDHLLSTRDYERGYDILGSIWRYFQSTAQLSELELWLQRIFDADTGANPTLARCRALIARAAMYYWKASWQEAANDYAAALAIAEAEDDRPLMTEIWSGISSTRATAQSMGQDLGDLSESVQRVHELGTELNDPSALALVEFFHAAAAIMGNPDPSTLAPDLLDAVIDFHEQSGSLMNIAHNRLMKSELEITIGDFQRARQSALEAVQTTEEAGDIFAMSWALQRLAITTVELGDPHLGARLAGASWAFRQRTGATFPPPFVPIEDPEVRARAVIGEEADRAFEEGKEIGLFEAIALARSAGSGA
ncbi:MAG: adenylate/guanylate cyclase domain-containing protein [Acidimicrobiia bacterium]|nr:adenylate/guanylate cyclase domain-containing protein [Acidimicrobiia bacterium]NNL28458.1 adenylate/guanylate cyclase domain-containing protein [Acidimicrobiia bacterium]